MRGYTEGSHVFRVAWRESFVGPKIFVKEESKKKKIRRVSNRKTKSRKLVREDIQVRVYSIAGEVRN